MCGRTRGQSGIEKSSTAKTMCFLPLPDMLSTLQNSLLSVECVNAVPHPSAMLGSLEAWEGMLNFVNGRCAHGTE